MRSRRITENCNASTADAGPSPERYNCRSSRRKSCAIDSPRCRKGRTTWWPAWTGRWSESWVWACLPTRARGILGNIGMAVHDDWQGKGIGTALMEAALDLADNWLNLTRIELRVYTDNAAGIALYEKFGFEVEGTHRRLAFRDGEYVDAYSMARLKP